MNPIIKVAVAGATGRMGREVVRMVLADPELELVAAIHHSDHDTDIGVIVNNEPCGVRLSNDLEQALIQTRPDVLVDFTTPHSVLF